ncbi:MAG: choice-of-anchor D domain-containing protein [Acidimicrobiales bacterium]
MARSRPVRVRVVPIVVVLAILAGALIAKAVVASPSAPASSPANVTTAAFNKLRTDWDPNEPNLSPSDIQSGTFGKIFSTRLDGSIYAQPLVYHGTVIVTTEKAYAYGLNSTTGKILWQRRFGKPFEASEIGCGDLTPDIGSTSTPVIDPSTGTVYLTTRLQSGPGLTNSHWWLQAVSATTGVEVSGFPVKIQGTPSNSPGVPFNDNYSMQRPGLLLLGGVVYIAFASDCDFTPYRGIVVGVSETTRDITTMWSDESGVGTNADSQAGIWQSGSGLVSDGANEILLTTGNGIAPPPSPGDTPPSTLSESVIRLHVNSDGSLTPTDFFSPSNAPTLDQNDTDLGSGGPIALPSKYFGNTAYPDLLVQVGKDGRIFLLNRDDLGGREQGPGGTDDTLQTLGPYDGVWGHPAAYGGQGGWVYVLESSGGGYLRALSYGVNGSGVPQLTSAGTSTESFGYTSGSPIVTSNGTTAGSAVVWAVYSSGSKGKDAELQAYAAIPTGGTLPLLWSANIGIASKFATPTSYDGMVYVGTRAGKLDAFGTLSNAPYSVTPVNFGRVAVGRSKTETVTITAHRSLTVTSVSAASGVLGVEGPTGRAPGATIQGVQGSTGVSGTQPIGGSVQPFSVSAPKGQVAVRSGGTYRFKVTFNPRTAGPVVAEVDLSTSAGSPSVPLSGYATSPGLLVSAPPLTFGTLDTGAGGSVLTFTVSNSWNRPEAITGSEVPSEPFVMSGMPKAGTVLAPQQAVTASVAFDPSAAGRFHSFLTVSADNGSVTIPISGTAVTGKAHMLVNPASLDFGTVKVGTSVTRTFSVTDSGTIFLIITRAAPPAGVFSTALPMPEGITLDPGTGVTQTVTFRPTSTGRFTGEYRMNSTSGQGWIDVELTGTGVSP